jgi:hypothetical protein
VAYVEPPTFVAETEATAADANILSEDIRYLKGQVDGLTASGTDQRRAANQSISNNTDTEISFDTEDFDIGGWYSSGTDVIAPAGAFPDGVTELLGVFRGRASFASNSTGKRRIQIHRNGTWFASMEVSANDSGDTDFSVVDFSIFQEGDVFTLVVRQTSGGALNVTEANLAVVRLFAVA